MRICLCGYRTYVCVPMNGFLCEKNGLTGNQTGTTKFDHVEEKEKFFDSAFYPFRIVLSLFV